MTKLKQMTIKFALLQFSKSILSSLSILGTAQYAN